MKITSAVIFGLVTSNFLFQAVNDQVWATAVERSFFEVTGIVCLLAGQWLWEKLP